MSVGCLGVSRDVWEVSGGCLRGVWGVWLMCSGVWVLTGGDRWCLGGVWGVSGGFWGVSSECLGASGGVWGVLDGVWMVLKTLLPIRALCAPPPVTYGNPGPRA